MAKTKAVVGIVARLAEEDTLAEIYRLQAEGATATTGSVAGRRQIRPATATSMFKRLARDGLVIYREYGGVSLTDAGRRVALGVLRRHRLVERFLTDLLGMPWEAVDSFADEMEHALPEAVVDALERVLGRPFTCPHGYPIPGKDGQLVQSPVQHLADLRPGEHATVARVDERLPGLLPYLETLGVRPGTPLRVLAVNQVDETVTLRVGDATHIVGPRITHAVSVTRPPQA